MTGHRDEPAQFWSRWSTLSASLLMAALSGISYAFGLYSDALQDRLGFSQRTVDLIASFGQLGLWSTFPVGLLMELLSIRLIFVLASLCSGLGVLYIALALNKDVQSNAVSIAFMFYIANFGFAAFGNIGQSTCVRNFPASDRGKICGLFKSVLGLSAAVYALLFKGLFGANHVIAFLLMIG